MLSDSTCGPSGTMPLGGVMRCIGPPMFGCPENTHKQRHTDFSFSFFFFSPDADISNLELPFLTSLVRLLDYVYISSNRLRLLVREVCAHLAVLLGPFRWVT